MYNEVANWLNNVLNQDIPEEVVAFCFNLYEDGNFQIENSVCVNIIGANEGEIIQLAKNLSMYMSQESSLIIRNPLKIELL